MNNILRDEKFWRTVWQLLSRFARSNKTTIMVLLTVLVAAAASDILGPVFFSKAISQLADGQQVWTSISIYIALITIASLIGRSTTFLGFALSESLNFFVSTEYFERLTRKRSDFFVNTNAAEIQSAFTRAQEAFRFFVNFIISGVLPGLLRVCFGIAILGSVLTPVIAIIVAVYGCGMIWLTYNVNKKVRPHLSAGVRLTQENAAFTGNAMHAMEVLRYFKALPWMVRRFDERAAGILLEWRKFSFLQMRYAVVMAIALLVQLALTFAIVLPGVHGGQYGVGEVVLFNLIIFQLNAPFEMVGRIIDDGVRAYENLQPFVTIWNAPEEKMEERNTTLLNITNGEVRFDAVSFEYANGRGVRDIDFKAGRGKINFIVGPTGSGKSTLFGLALKKMEPTAGTIRIDGTPIQELSRSDWYQHIAIVPQDPTLINDTVANNILVGRPRDDAKLIRILTSLSLSHFMERSEKGLDTVVGERGMALSGGERQRIAIARALYGDPGVLFLDEASSALDETIERQIFSDLRHIMDQVTIIAITHRLGMIRADDGVMSLVQNPDQHS